MRPNHSRGVAAYLLFTFALSSVFYFLIAKSGRVGGGWGAYIGCLNDYWLNLIAQKTLSQKTRITGNLGYLFAGNTSTGALGTQTTRGHVVPGGLSLLHDFRPSLTLGAELFGAYAENGNLGKSQFQAMAGGQYVIRKGVSLCFGVLGGKYVASPRLGGQIGFAIDFP
jgi:hypothetical protein